jgi:riboflavin kinase / FMN adenylyltransferase
MLAAPPVIHRICSSLIEKKPLCAVLGNFDGVHRGHQLLLKQARKVANAKSLPLTVLTFFPHPLSVLRKGITIEPLSTLHQKVHALRLSGVDQIAYLHFTHSVAACSAEDFVDICLVQGLGISHLVLGEDAAIGHGREAGPEQILSLIRDKGGSGEIVDFLAEGDDRKIGSRYIREAVRGARLGEAHDLLGRPFSLCGRVVRGAGRGEKMGVPTLNLSTWRQLLPPYGVYASVISVCGNLHQAVVNVGVRPTFDGMSVSVEGHLLDATVERAKARRAEFFLIERIRSEQRFSSSGELVEQIKLDCKAAKNILKNVDLSLIKPWACV